MCYIDEEEKLSFIDHAPFLVLPMVYDEYASLKFLR